MINIKNTINEYLISNNYLLSNNRYLFLLEDLDNNNFSKIKDVELLKQNFKIHENFIKKICFDNKLDYVNICNNITKSNIESKNVELSLSETLKMINTEKCLVLLYGVPGSGKSTFIKNFLYKYPVFSNDNNRIYYTYKKTGKIQSYNDCYKYSSKHNKDFQKYNYENMISMFLNINSSIVIDNTNTYFNPRMKVLNGFKRVCSNNKIVVIYFNPSIDILKRNLLHREMTTGKKISIDIVEKFLKDRLPCFDNEIDYYVEMGDKYYAYFK